MSVRIQYGDGCLCALLSGEIDHFAASEIRLMIDCALREKQPRLLMLDFAEVPFMDSSGIGLILGRKKLAEELSGAVVIKNANAAVKKIIMLAGLSGLAID